MNKEIKKIEKWPRFIVSDGKGETNDTKAIKTKTKTKTKTKIKTTITIKLCAQDRYFSFIFGREKKQGLELHQ